MSTKFSKTRPSDSLGAHRWDTMREIKTEITWQDLNSGARRCVEMMVRSYLPLPGTGNDCINVSKKTLAKVLGKDTSTIKRYLRQIRQSGLLVASEAYDKNGRQTTNRWVIGSRMTPSLQPRMTPLL